MAAWAAARIDVVHFGVSISGEPLRNIVRDTLQFLFAMILALAIITFVPEFHQKGAPMTKPIYILNGPNLNRLGTREPEIYGRTTLAEIETMCREAAPDQPIVFRQSNREYEIIEWVQEAIDEASGIIINPAAFTFTSIAIMDALKMFPGPIIELHISNIHRREPIYHRSYVSPVATAVIAGLGSHGYPTAVRAMRDLIGSPSGSP
jgi:3-dehydroquinate dehydratase-2